MNDTYKAIMDIIDIERYKELNCAKECQWLRKRILNPIRKIQYYIDERRFMNHVVGIEIMTHAIEKAFKES